MGPDELVDRDDDTSQIEAEPAASPARAATGRAISRQRLILVDALITITTLLLVVGIFSVWANRLLFSPDNWSTTSTRLLQDPNIRSTTANYLVDQLYTNVNVAGLIRSGLPSQFQGLAAPAAGALRNAAVQGAELALTRPRVQSLWAQANRVADRSFIAVVDGNAGPVGTERGVVTLNLGAILDNIASRLGLPSSVSARLPANVATLTVLRSDQLKYVQNGGNAVRGLALWLTILVPVLYGLALLLARGHRRRTLMTIGFAAMFAGLLVVLGRSIMKTQVANALTEDASLRTTIKTAYAISTGILGDVSGAVILGGAVLVLAAWFGGPARVARAGREAIAPFLREHPVATYAITLGVMALLFIWDPIHATGTPAGILTFTLLALFGTEILIRQTAREFPEARAGATREAIGARIQAMRGRPRSAAPAPAPTAPTVTQQLAQLAELRTSGALTADEYQAAKSEVLHG